MSTTGDRINAIGDTVRKTRNGNGVLDLVVRIPRPGAGYEGELVASGSKQKDSGVPEDASLMLSDFDHMPEVITAVIKRAQQRLAEQDDSR